RRADDERDRFQIALWRAQSGDASRPDELRWAARRALFHWDGPTAEQLARAALRSGVDLESAYLFAEALYSQRRGDDAAAAFAAAAELAGPESLRAQVACGWSSTLTNLLDRRDEAGSML